MIMNELILHGFTRRVASTLAYGQVISSASDLYVQPWSGASGGLRERLGAIPGFGKKSLAEVERLRLRHHDNDSSSQLGAGREREMRIRVPVPGKREIDSSVRARVEPNGSGAAFANV